MRSNLNGRRVLDSTYCSARAVSDVSAVLVLLVSAELSMEAHSIDRHCIDSLKKCISAIKRRYNVAENELSTDIVWKETNMSGLLCLLEYVEAEVRERLHDRGAAEEIQFCIDRLGAPGPNFQ